MKVLDRKFRRDIVGSRGMLFAVIAIIAVGTGSFVGMHATFNNLGNARRGYYSQCRMADFWVDLKKAPVIEVERLRNLPGISELRERISFPVIVDLEGVDKPVGGLAISMPPDPNPVINSILIERGSYFTTDRRNEVIVSEKFAQARNIEPGSFIHAIMDGHRKKLFVVGTAISAEHIYLAPPGGIVDNPRQYGVLFIKRDYAEDVFGFHGACNNLLGLLTPEARGHPEAVLNRLSHELDSYGVFSSIPRRLQFSNLTLNAEMGGLKTMATMFPALFLMVAALVLNVLMTRMVEQQRTIVGTLKALGYTNRGIFDHFLGFGWFVGLLGGVVGCILGYWISAGMTTMYRGVFEFPRLVNELYPALMLWAILISVVCAVLGSLRGVRRVARLDPAEAMRAPAPPVCGGILLERWTGLWTRLDFRWQMVLRGMFRNRNRTLVAITAAAMGAAMVVMAFGFVDSMNHMIDFQFNKVLLSDYQLSLRDETGKDVLHEVRRLPGVNHVEPDFSVPCTFYNGNARKKGAITGLLPDSRLMQPCRKDGTVTPVPPAGLLMTARLAEQLNFEEGDTVTFVPVKGNRRTYHVPLTKTVESMIGLAVYADYEYLNRLLGEAGAVSAVQISARQTPEEKAAFSRELKRSPMTQSLGETALQKAAITKQFKGAMQGMATMMIMFAGVIFFGSILNGSLISISERQREIATFRVLGYQSMEVGAIFLRENMLANLTGAIIGLPLGYLLLLGMMSGFVNDAFAMPAALRPETFVYTMLLTLAFVLGAHWIIQRNIARMHWQEALTMKE